MDTQLDTANTWVALLTRDLSVQELVNGVAEKNRFRTREYSSVGLLLESKVPFEAICVDLDSLSPHESSLVGTQIESLGTEVPVVAFVSAESVQTNIDDQRQVLYEILTKPLSEHEVLGALRRATDRFELKQSIRALQEALGQKSGRPEIVAESPKMQEVVRQAERVLASDITVTLFGESGVGKDLVAKMIHEKGRRSDGPFVIINCAAIPDALHEAELFGHQGGAFRNAQGVHPGRFEQASGGTLYLDEIGEMSSLTQASLLKALQEKCIRHLGGTEDIPIDVRIICSTRRNLQADVEAGRFREDLYFRLVVYPITVPPLRERSVELLPIVEQTLVRLRSDVGRRVERVSAEALRALGMYDWPGNVRELEGIIHSAMLSAEGDVIEIKDLPPDIQLLAMKKADDNYLEAGEVIPIRELERRAIQQALRATSGSVEKAAKLLGMGRATLYRRLAKYDSLQERVAPEG